MLTPPNNNYPHLDFEDISKAFVGRPKEFVQVLKAVQEDFINSHMMIVDAISEGSLDNFRRINHNLRGNIILFKISQVAQLMEKVYKSLENKSREQDNDLKEEIHEEFNLIFQSLENKIKELSIK